MDRCASWVFIGFEGSLFMNVKPYRVCPYCGDDVSSDGWNSNNMRCLRCRVIWYVDGKVSYWDVDWKWHGIPLGCLLVMREYEC